MAHRPRWGDAECISNGDALICETAASRPSATGLA